MCPQLSLYYAAIHSLQFQASAQLAQNRSHLRLAFGAATCAAGISVGEGIALAQRCACLLRSCLLGSESLLYALLLTDLVQVRGSGG